MSRVAVLGAGIVGVCAALEAQRAGFEVVLIDRKRPGREASFGNAGVLSESSVVVVNNAGLLRALPRLLLDLFLKRSVGFRTSPSFVLKHIGWFLRFLSYCNERQTLHAARALRGLMVASLARHKALMAEAEIDALLRHQAWLKVFRNQAAFEAFKAELAIMDAVGVCYSVYEREQLRQLEPGLAPIYAKAVLLDETCGVSNPAKVTDAYLGLFLASGGAVLEDSITGLEQGDAGWRVVLASGGSVAAEQIVLSAGAWSGEIASWLGYRIPLLWERGYHRHLVPSASESLKRAVHDIEGGYVMAPMESGIRITTGVEMAARDAPPDYTQLEAVLCDARRQHGFGAAVDSAEWAGAWMGCRPTLVDSLPMLGAAPRHEGLYFNFGHQHIGLSTAPGSGQALAALLAGRVPRFDISPFDPKRFSI